MSVLNIRCSPSHVLTVMWETMVEAHAISVCVARDSNFTDTLRHFVVPVVNSVSLDVGQGTWYIRVGAWVGDTMNGVIEWSDIYGPFTAMTTKRIVPMGTNVLPIIHKQAIQHGIRIHTGVMAPYYALFEVSDNPNFPASSTRFRYMFDPSRGYVDGMGLLYPNTYSIRFSTFGPVNTVFPKDSVQVVGAGRVLHRVQCARHIRPTDSTAKSIGSSDKALLIEAKERGPPRFTSHSDYLRFQAAKAKASEEKVRIG